MVSKPQVSEAPHVAQHPLRRERGRKHFLAMWLGLCNMYLAELSGDPSAEHSL